MRPTHIMYNLKTVLMTLCFINLNNLCRGNDWHYALSSVDELFDLEVEHLAQIETYIQNEHERLDEIRR